MPKKKSKKIESNPNSALAQIAQLPKVGNGLGGYDISLGFSHRYALEIASKTLAGTPENVATDIIKNMQDIFHQWQNEFGVYPAKFAGLFGLGASKEQELARDYCKRVSLAAALEGKEPVLPEPWECCPFVTTRLGLFWKLKGDNYEPLIKFLKKDWTYYEKTLAILIILTNRNNSEYQSSDCIEAALRLASSRLEKQEIAIKIMKPDAEAAFNRRKQKNLSVISKKEEKERKILLAYEECNSKFGQEKFPLKEVAIRTGIPLPTVSKYLRSVGFLRYKTK